MNNSICIKKKVVYLGGIIALLLIGSLYVIRILDSTYLYNSQAQAACGGRIIGKKVVIEPPCTKRNTAKKTNLSTLCNPGFQLSIVSGKSSCTLPKAKIKRN